VDLDARNAEAYDQLPPMVVDLGRFGQTWECLLKAPQNLVGCRGCLSKPVVLNRSSSDVPKLYEVLAGGVETFLFQCLDGAACADVARIGRYREPHQDVGVD
jgi:hypothetical protein